MVEVIACRKARLMVEVVVFIAAAIMVLVGAVGRRDSQPSGALRAVNGAHPVRRRRPVPVAWTPSSLPPCRSSCMPARSSCCSCSSSCCWVSIGPKTSGSSPIGGQRPLAALLGVGTLGLLLAGFFISAVTAPSPAQGRERLGRVGRGKPAQPRHQPVLRITCSRSKRPACCWLSRWSERSSSLGAATEGEPMMLAVLSHHADLVSRARGGALHHRCHGRHGPAQPDHHVHVRRAHAQRGQPHLRRHLAGIGRSDGPDVTGQTVVFFVLVVAAAEVVVGLGIIVALLRRRPGATADDVATMKG